MHSVQEWTQSIQKAVERVIYGKSHVIEKLLVAFLCRGHVLLEDVPGVGKTILARALALSLGGEFRRTQCTPDLLPADVLGVSVYNEETREFELKEGPVITNIYLVDEINRATPRTQSSLLEAMTEGSITVEGRPLALPEPFFMIATENPVEFEGTFQLPEAQRDRFFFAMHMGYPPEEAEKEIMKSQRRLTHPVTDLSPVTRLDVLPGLEEEIDNVTVSSTLEDAILEVVDQTRNDPRLRLGASPRASITLYRGAQALAAVRGRGAVEAADVRELVPLVLQKRVALKSENLLKGLSEMAVIEEIRDRVIPDQMQ